MSAGLRERDLLLVPGLHIVADVVRLKESHSCVIILGNPEETKRFLPKTPSQFHAQRTFEVRACTHVPRIVDHSTDTSR
jgi:hypothetical protein